MKGQESMKIVFAMRDHEGAVRYLSRNPRLPEAKHFDAAITYVDQAKALQALAVARKRTGFNWWAIWARSKEDVEEALPRPEHGIVYP